MKPFASEITALPEPFTALLSVRRDSCDAAVKVASVLVDKGFGGVYVSVNQPATVVFGKLPKKHAGKMFFVDAVTALSDCRVTNTGSCFFVQGPSYLTELGITISAAVNSLGSKKKFVLLDRASDLFAHNEPQAASSFLRFLSTEFKNREFNCVYLVSRSDAGKAYYPGLGQLCDKTIVLQ